jgi:hypothetical protein
LFDVPLSSGLTVDDGIFLGTAGAYTTSRASGANGFAVPTTHVADVFPLASIW